MTNHPLPWRIHEKEGGATHRFAVVDARGLPVALGLTREVARLLVNAPFMQEQMARISRFDTFDQPQARAMAQMAMATLFKVETQP